MASAVRRLDRAGAAAILFLFLSACSGGSSSGGAAGAGGANGAGGSGASGGASGRGGNGAVAGSAAGAGGGGAGAAGAAGNAGGGAGAAGAAGRAGTAGGGGSGGAGTAGTAGGAGGSAAGGSGASGGAQGLGGASGRGGSSGSGGSGGNSGNSGSSGSSGAGATGGGGASGGGGSPAPAWNWVGVIGTGQSLSVGGHGNAPAMPIGATLQRYKNLKLSLGSATVPPWDATNAQLSMVPLVETLRAIATGYPSPYPANIYGESYHTAMSDEITTQVMTAQGHDYVTAHTEVGEAGQGIAVLQKGATDTGTTGRAYVATVFEVTAIARLAKAQGKTYGVGALVLTHGEADAGSATFEADMVKLWQSYNQDLPALTAQSTSIPMLLSQQHSEPTTAGSNSASTLAQWQIGVDHPGDFICTGPKYQYAYVSDNIHLTNPDYERLGEKYGQVFYQRVVLGNSWQPLQPTGAERNARVITVHFHVPVPPLAWDTTLTPMPHQTAYTEWAQGRGFEVKAGATRITISSVAISGTDVQITCGTDLPASGLVVGYASTTDGSIRPNGTVRWGQLRDSDPFVGSMTGKAQPNYCVAFELNVP